MIPPNNPTRKKFTTNYTPRQDLVNGLIHALAVIFGITCLPMLTALSTAHGNIPGIIGSGIYGFCFLLLFASSTAFHLVKDPATKRTFEIMDHIGIYFLIAGTYTPFLLVYVYNSFGITLLVVLWSLTIIGTFFKIWFTGRFNIISIIIYVAMGWIMFAGGKQFFTSLPTSVLIMIIAGCLIYSLGIFFYSYRRYTHSHTVWHSIVLVAAICHYVAILLAM